MAVTVDWASFEKALAGLHRSGTAWSPELRRQLDTYLQLIAEWGEAINVTGVRSPQALVDSLFVESLAGPAAFPELFGVRHSGQSGRRVADLGSGAGFPGMVLALACPDLDVTLFESSGKKAAFLEEVRLRTNARVTVVADRFETAAAAAGFDTVVSRAVELPERLGSAVARALAPGGAWLLYGGPKMIERARGMGEVVVRDALTVSVACLKPQMFHVKHR